MNIVLWILAVIGGLLLLKIIIALIVVGRDDYRVTRHYMMTRPQRELWRGACLWAQRQYGLKTLNREAELMFAAMAASTDDFKAKVVVRNAASYLPWMEDCIKNFATMDESVQKITGGPSISHLGMLPLTHGKVMMLLTAQ